MHSEKSIANKKIVVIGLSRSGRAVALLARKKGAQVFVSEITRNRELQKNARDLKKIDIKVELGQHRPSFFSAADLFITSPGVRSDARPLVWARRHGVEIISEIEFASWFCPLPVIAVTGTNGKTTVTTLIGRILKDAGRRVIICGNIGNPFSGEEARFKLAEIVVLEVSSFQLQYIKSFHPRVSIITNITRNHFDHHHSFAEYCEAKAKIFVNQNKNDYTILNFADKTTRAFGKRTKARVLYFDRGGKIFSNKAYNYYGACWLTKEEILTKLKGKTQMVVNSGQLKLKGLHNLENIMAAILAAQTQNVNVKSMVKTLNSFSGIKHRCEFVSQVNGVNFINDSKATTVDATLKALSMFPNKRVILICGGRDKGSDFGVIRHLAQKKVKLMVLIGEAKVKIKKAIAGTISILTAPSLRKAIISAFKQASRGDSVLLSPMCASFDMFENYEHRGQVYKQLIKTLRKKWICGRRG